MNKVLLVVLMGMVLTLGIFRDSDGSSDWGDVNDGESEYAVLLHPAPLSLNS